MDAADEAVLSVGRGAGGEGEGVRLIVLVHCSHADVMVSASPGVGTILFGTPVKHQKGVFGV